MFSSASSWLQQDPSQDAVQSDSQIRRESDGSISLQSATSTAPSVENTPANNFIPIFPTIEEPTMEEVPTDRSRSNSPGIEQYSELRKEEGGISNEVRSKVYTDAYTHGYTEGYIARSAEPPVTKQMPIAIVGMACRLPGEKKDLTTPDEFWELCSRARSGWSEIPEQRFEAASFQHPNPGKSGCFNPTGGCFLKEDIGLFDAPFFNLTAQEATSMDPQQRMLLEVVFEALDSAGIPKHSIVGKEVGVFVGGSFSEYDVQAFSDSDTIPMYQATGCAFAMQSNRLSHFFDLRGPSFTMDTACSSSMVALHQACQSIRNGESQSAIVASAHLNMIPEVWVSYSMSRLFSDEGRSFSFDSRGTGYGRGEGCGVLILKPLDQALRDNDAIRSVIVASGINQDGKTPGITMPNGNAQEDLMKSVYKSADIDPTDCGYVEAHGTGTKVGDPIEARALYNVFGEGRSARNPLFVGSVKSNIGHLEAASGIVAVIKTALMLERGFVLPNYDYRRPNPKIPLAKWNLKVPISQRPWPRPKRFASVNNFGFGGTNGHVVLERAPFVKRFEGLEAGDSSIKTRMLYVLSANDKSTLEGMMKSIGIYLEQRPEIFQNDLLSNLAYTLGQRRSLLQWRVAVSTDSSFELVQDLNGGKLVTSKVVEPLRIGFVFTGQGAQWNAMGRELYGNYPVYTAAIDACDKHLLTLGASFSLVQELMKDTESSRVHEAHISQPICTALQIALVDLLKSWNVVPTAVTGHSSGEIGAAYAAGILPLNACMAIAYYRGMVTLTLKRKHPELKGAMMAVGCTKEEVIALIDGLVHKEVRVACFNSPTSLTISGDELAIDELQGIMEGQGLFARKLQVEMAYHSHHMELVAKEYRAALQSIECPITSDVLFHSSLLGHVVDGDTLEISYWVQNLTRPVRFSEAVSSMCQPRDEHKTGVNMIIEIGPHAALAGPVKQILKACGASAMKIPYASALVRNKDAVETAMALASMIFTKGSTDLYIGAVNFPKVGKPPALLVDLPRYPWNHQTKYWHESRFSQKSKHRKMPRNDLLGILAGYSNDLEPTWRNNLSLDNLPWLRHHKIQGLVLLPMSGFIAMAVEAVSQLAISRDTKFDAYQLRDVAVSKPLVLQDEDIEVTLQLRPSKRGDIDSVDIWYEFQIKSWSMHAGWIEHCTGFAAATLDTKSNIHDELIAQVTERRLQALVADANSPDLMPMDTEALFASLSERGVSYGSTFTGIHDCKASIDYSTGYITVADTSKEMPSGYQTTMVFHPTLLEQLIELYWPILEADNAFGFQTVFLASAIERIKITRGITDLTHTAGDSLRAFCRGRISSHRPRPTQMSMFATTREQARDMVIELTNLTISPIIERAATGDHVGPRQICYKLDWDPIFQPLSMIPDYLSNHVDIYASAAEFPSKQSSMNDTTANNLSKSDSIPERKFELDVPVTIIWEDSETQIRLATTLADALESLTGCRPVYGNLGSVETNDRLLVVLNELERPLFSDITPRQFSGLKNILANVQGVLWTVRGAYLESTTPEANMVVGFSRSLRSEALLKFATIDFDSVTSLDIEDTARAILHILCTIFQSTTSADCELEFMERNGNFFTPRFVDDAKVNEIVHKQINRDAFEQAPFIQVDRHLKLSVTDSTASEAIQFIDQESADVLSPTGIEVEIRAIGMNQRDVSVAAGHTDELNCGIEFSGVVTRVGQDVHDFEVNDRVAGLSLEHGVYSTRTITDAGLVFKISHNTSFEAAASIPVAYCSTYYGLLVLGRLVNKERILIHGAASATGQAAIYLAQMTGADIFATVDTVDSKELLINTFGLRSDRIFSKSSKSFALALQDVMGSDGDGIDVVMICTPTRMDTLQETRRCLSSFGRFIDMIKQEDKSIPSVAHLGSNRTSIAVDLHALAIARPKIMKRLVADVSELLEHGRLKPLTTTVHRISELGAALKQLQSGTIDGKLVISPQPDDIVQVMPSAKNTLLEANATYILIGGTGGLGRDFARWMAMNGARHIVLVSRSASPIGKVKDLMEELLAGYNATIYVQPCDITDSVAVDKLIIGELAELPPIKGVVHGAMVLKDILFEKMVNDDFVAVTRSKVQGAWNFHNALKSTKLDFFIAISSAAAAVGNRGQSAYSAANSFLDAFIQYRLGQGLPGVSIALTAVSDAGYLAENDAAATEVAKNLGSDAICLDEVLALMRAAIEGHLAETCNNHVTTGLRITNPPPFWANDAKFRHLRFSAEADAAQNADVAAIISYNNQVKSATTLGEAQEAITKGLLNKLAEVLMLDEEDMDVTRNLSAYALDSLVAIEVRNFITREFEANLQVLELLSSGSVETLAKLICKKSQLVGFEEVV